MQFNKPNIQGLQDYLANSQSQGQGSEINWWSIPSGMSSIRVLPPWDPTGRIALGVYSHRIEYKDPDSNYTKYSWTCVDKTFGKQCNICAGLKRLQEAGITTTEYQPTSVTYYVNALVIYDPVYDNAVKMGRNPEGNAQKPYSLVVMRIPKTVYSWIVSQITSPLVGDITDPVNGCNIVITKEGTGINTRYSCTLSPEGRTAIPNEVLNSLELYNLDDIFSTGFDDDRINKMVDSLYRSASGIQQQAPQFQQQMPSYGNAPVYPNPVLPNPASVQTPHTTATQMYYPSVQLTSQQPVASSQPPWESPSTMSAPAGIPASPFGATPQNVAQPVQAPPTMQPSSPSPVTPTTVQAPVQPPVAPQVNLPKCYGQHNPSSVNCVVCPHEIECSQKAGN